VAVLNSLNSNVVKTYLDGIFLPEFNLQDNPEIATAEDPFIFNQYKSDKAQETLEEFKGIGDWETRGELQVPAEAQPQSIYTQSFVNAELAKGVTLSGRFFDDDQHAMVSMVARDFATKGRAAKNKDAISVYRGAFATTTYGDGVYLCSASHPITGGTQSNTSTVKLSEANLNTGIVALAEAKERDGVQVGRMPNALLVTTANYKRASIILDTELRSGTANNDLNVYSTKYQLWLKATPYLGTVAGGSDDYWFLLAKNHGVVRFLRQDVKTTIIDRTLRENDSYYYRGQFRQAVGAISFVGVWGSTGTTSSYDA